MPLKSAETNDRVACLLKANKIAISANFSLDKTFYSLIVIIENGYKFKWIRFNRFLFNCRARKKNPSKGKRGSNTWPWQTEWQVTFFLILTMTIEWWWVLMKIWMEKDQNLWFEFIVVPVLPDCWELRFPWLRIYRE